MCVGLCWFTCTSPDLPSWEQGVEELGGGQLSEIGNDWQIGQLKFKLGQFLIDDSVSKVGAIMAKIF